MAKADDTSLPVVAPEPPPAPVRVTAPAQAYPVIGHIHPLSTPRGVVMYRVLKASNERVVSVPLSRAESQKLIAELQAQQKQQATTPEASWWRRFWRRNP